MAHYALAQTHYSRGDLGGLKAEAERAIELNPNDTTVLAAFAVNLAFAGDWERGNALARRAAALNPSHPDWLYMMVSADHYRQGRYEEALEELARWNQRGDPRWHLHRAAIYGQLGRRREANAEIDALVRAVPAFAEEPLRELRKYFLSQELADAYLEGLRKAGLEVGG
jgi:tetratricopeptide (TPR) repeat protein